MGTTIVLTHFALGNTAIQLLIGHLISEHLGHSLDVCRGDELIIQGSYRIIREANWTREAWTNLDSWIEEFYAPTVALEGYFQHSEPLIERRAALIEWAKSCALPVNKRGVQLRRLLTLPKQRAFHPDDIVVHIRLGDFKAAGLIIDPAVTLQVVRAMRAKTPAARVIIVSEKPQTEAEDHYLRLFEEFSPQLQHGDELEDFVTLRDAPRLVCSNSTFAWLAAFFGSSKERWIPAPTYNALGRIDPTDNLYEAPTYDIDRLLIPKEPEYVCTEFYMSLCDLVVVTDKKIKELHKWLLIGAPLEKQLNVKDDWSPATVAAARALFVHSDPECLAAVTRYTWPSLRLFIFGGGDNTVRHAAFKDFLEAHPGLYIWEMNNIDTHPRVRTLPIGFENTMWREGRGTEPLKICRYNEREYNILMTFCSPTHPVRSIWSNEALNLRDLETFTYVRGFLDHPTFTEFVRSSQAVICPPGNGVDTHRHWETLAAGAHMILQSNEHTENLQQEYPSLPIIPIVNLDQLRTLVLPAAPAPFHPLLLTEFWRILARSYSDPTLAHQA